ncbi:MAG: M20/M25/M40 family metallo-hydrolase [Oscillospiraceae bacterium]|jgi:endoglucanase|nr:M20/M25/M40 family metallo-hydrolase [Oscillospiraceae bacterium]
MQTPNKNTTLLFDAHLDTVGVIVTENCPGGFVKAAKLGSIDPRTLPAAELTFTAPDGTRVFGVVNALAPHLTGGSGEMSKVEDLYIDTGGVELPAGTPGVFRQLTADNVQLSAPYLDNRVGCAVLLDVMRRLNDTASGLDLAYLFSTQEEVGLRGAGPGAYSAEADYCVVVDATFAKSPFDSGYETFTAGAGITIAVGPNMHRGFTAKLRAVAERHGIPYSVEVLHSSSGTNAERIQLSRFGVATALVSVPVRYMHTPAEFADPRDIQAASDLLYYLVTDWSDGE